MQCPRAAASTFRACHVAMTWFWTIALSLSRSLFLSFSPLKRAQSRIATCEHLRNIKMAARYCQTGADLCAFHRRQTSKKRMLQKGARSMTECGGNLWGLAWVQSATLPTLLILNLDTGQRNHGPKSQVLGKESSWNGGNTDTTLGPRDFLMTEHRVCMSIAW